jgi:hypothetical protein
LLLPAFPPPPPSAHADGGLVGTQAERLRKQEEGRLRAEERAAASRARIEAARERDAQVRAITRGWPPRALTSHACHRQIMAAKRAEFDRRQREAKERSDVHKAAEEERFRAAQVQREKEEKDRIAKLEEANRCGGGPRAGSCFAC